MTRTSRRRKERERDGKLAGHEEGEINQTSRRGAGMPTGIRAKSVVEHGRVCIFADSRTHQLTVAADIGDPSNDILAQMSEVRLATRKHIGPRFAKHILHGTLRIQPGLVIIISLLQLEEGFRQERVEGRGEKDAEVGAYRDKVRRDE